MASASLQSVLLQFRPLDPLLDRLRVRDPVARELFESSWQQLCRHAPLFGYADHPDIDDEHLDQVQDVVHRQLADWAQRGEVRAIEQAAVRTFLGVLRSARGLVATRPRAELATLLDPANAKLCAAAQCRYVPLAEAFWYNHSLARHYGVQRESFAELIDWCVASLQSADPPELVRRFVADMHRLEPSRFGDPPNEPDEPEPKFDVVELPDEVLASPVALAEFAASSAPEHDLYPGEGYPLTLTHTLTLHWEAILGAAASELLPVSAADVDTPKRLPGIIELALLVHLLGLEDSRRKAVVAAAADRLLVHRLIPAAREVGAKHNRHEPIAAYLVSVIAVALRPWSFAAPPLTCEQRIVLLALLAELATGKARKLLHQEKQHADAHAEPELIRAAVNRMLDRWPERVHAVSPKQRIDRVAAGFRYLNRVRRGVDPRARDLALVVELVHG
jgi:hypothetical protein